MDEGRGAAGEAARGPAAPGKQTLTQLIFDASHGAAYGPAERTGAGGGGAAGGSAAAMARAGVGGPAEPLPFRATIQQLFGRHDVSGIRAHIGGRAAEASAQLGAEAFAHGEHVAFAGPPDLRTAAHEAAHVVQQRSGLQLAGGIGAHGDEHERHADAVADQVAHGESAEALLDRYGAPGSSAASGAPVQRKQKHLEDALGLDDLPSATAYFARAGISKATVGAFIHDPGQPAYERERVRNLWNRGYDKTPRSWYVRRERGRGRGRDPQQSDPPSRKRARSQSPDRPKRARVAQTLSFAYWNMERLGQDSDPQKIQRYVDYVLDVLETYHPTFLVFEEMGDAVAKFGKLLQSSDLLARYRQHAARKTPEDDADAEITDEEDDDVLHRVLDDGPDLEAPDDSGDELALELREPVRPATYPVSREYGYLPGPQFHSGNFREYYPLLFDKAVVIGTPELLVTRPRNLTEIDGGRQDGEKAVMPYVKPRRFQAGKDEEEDDGDDARTPRGPAFWKIRMKALDHNTRLAKVDGKPVPPPDDEVLEIPDPVAMSEVIGLLLQDGAWTEDFTPSFIAEALNLEIRVLHPGGAPYYTACPTAPRPGLRAIHCVFTGDHYNSCTERPLGGQGGSGSDQKPTDKSA